MDLQMRVAVPAEGMVDMALAVAALKARIISTSTMGELLGQLLLACQYGKLYKHFFPQEWRERKSTYKIDKLGVEMSEGEQDFHRLIDMHYFPVWDMACDERSEYIPILVDSYDLEDVNSAPENMHAADLLFLYMEGPENLEDEARACIVASFGALPERCCVGENRVDWDMFRRKCRNRGGVWALVPDAMDVATKSTGNVFIDAQPEANLGEFIWDISTVRATKKLSEQSQRLWKRNSEVCHWLEGHPERVDQLVALFNKCVFERKRDKKDQ